MTKNNVKKSSKINVTKMCKKILFVTNGYGEDAYSKSHSAAKTLSNLMSVFRKTSVNGRRTGFKHGSGMKLLESFVDTFVEA